MDQFHLLHQVLLRQNHQLQLKTPKHASPAKSSAGLEVGYIPETVKEEHSGEERAVDADNVSVALLAKAVYNLQSTNQVSR